jgi:hypothetical protein
VVADAAVESAGLIGFLFESWDALATSEPISRQFSVSGNGIHYDIERTMLPLHYAWSDRAIHANAQTTSRDFQITSSSTARHRGTKMVNARRSLELSLTNVSGLPSRNGAERGLRGAGRSCRLPRRKNVIAADNEKETFAFRIFSCANAPCHGGIIFSCPRRRPFDIYSRRERAPVFFQTGSCDACVHDT